MLNMNRLRVTHECDRQRDERTDILIANTALNQTLRGQIAVIVLCLATHAYGVCTGAIVVCSNSFFLFERCLWKSLNKTRPNSATCSVMS